MSALPTGAAQERTSPDVSNVPQGDICSAARFAQLFWSWLAIVTRRQAHRERRAFTRLARNRHVAAHHARQFATNRKAQAGAAELPRGQRVGLSEFGEQLRLLLRRHANAGIGNRKLDPVAAVYDPCCL